MNEPKTDETTIHDEIIVLGNSFKKIIPLYGIVT